MKINRGIVLSMGCTLLMQTLAVWTAQEAFSVADCTEKTLHKVARSGDVEAVQALLNAGTDVNAPDFHGSTPLVCAINGGYVDVVRVLLNAGADVNKAESFWGTRALNVAVSYARVEIIRLLLKAGAAVNALNGESQPALFNAARKGHVGVVRILLDAGAEATAVDCQGKTALHVAAEKGHAEVVQILLDAGAVLTAVDRQGKTAVHMAAEKGHEDLVRLMLWNRDPKCALPLPQQIEKSRLHSLWFSSAPVASRALTTATGKHHYPIIFLIDQDKDEGIRLKKQGNSVFEVSLQSEGAVFHELLMHVSRNNKLMVVSKGLAYGLIALAYEKRDYAAVKRVIKERWIIYNVPETQFTVWVPRAYTDDYAAILKLGDFKKLSMSTRGEILRYCPSQYARSDDLCIKELQRTYHEQDLTKIFDLDQLARDKNAICDVLLVGHGESSVCVAGLPVDQDTPEAGRITSLLSFLSDNLNTGAVCIRSCHAGGQNATLMRTRKDGNLINNKYALIICSVTDRVTVSDSKRLVSWTNAFFDFALEFCQQRDGALEKFTKNIVPAQRIPNAEIDPHGYAAFPQVWLPGGMEYQARGVTNDVYMVGRVPARIAAERGRSIELKDRQMALWYPKVVNAPVNVAPTGACAGFASQLFKSELRTAEEYINANLPQSELDRIHASYSALASLLRMHGKDMVQRWIKQAREHLYPEVILMGGAAHRRLWLKKVVVEDGVNPLMGIVRFLRDSFADANWRSTERKDILIESLEGANDVPFHMEMAAERSERPSPTSLYEKLRATAGQKITLKNVMVRINAPEHLGEIAFYVPLDGQWWLYTVSLKRSDDSSVRAWDFKPTTAPAIEAFKKAIDAHVVPVGRIAAKFGGTNSTVS